MELCWDGRKFHVRISSAVVHLPLRSTLIEIAQQTQQNDYDSSPQVARHIKGTKILIYEYIRSMLSFFEQIFCRFWRLRYFARKALIKTFYFVDGELCPLSIHIMFSFFAT